MSGRNERDSDDEREGDFDDVSFGSGAYMMERQLRAMARFMGSRKFATMEEAQAALNEQFVGRGLSGTTPDTPIERAQEFAFRAMEAGSPADEQKWMEMALGEDPDCPDAIRLSARWEPDPEKERAILDRAAAKALERLGGASFLEEHRGRLWANVLARPYMRVLEAQAATLDREGRADETAAAWERLLDLDRNDSMGIRYSLLGMHLERGDPDAFDAVRRRYDGEESASFHWGTVLAALLRGDERAAEQARSRAAKANASVAEFILEPWRLPEEPSVYAVGSVDEAVVVALETLPAWLGRPNAIAWLASHTPAVRPAPKRRAVLYESIRPAGVPGPVPAWIPWVFHTDMEVPPALRRAVRNQRTSAVPWLLSLLARDDLAKEDAPAGGYAPATAATLLGECRADEAVPALLDAVRAGEPEEVLFEHAVVALGRIGAPAVEPVLAALDDPPASWDPDEWRGYLTEVLSESRVRDPRIRAAIRTVLRTDPGLGGFCAGTLNDPELLPDLHRALAECEHDDVADLAEAIVDLGGALSPKEQAKRERAAGSARERDRSRSEAEAEEEARRLYWEDHAEEDDFDPLGHAVDRDAPDGPSLSRDVRPGRNDPCWCGSGKKYKKCHLAADETRRDRGPGTTSS